MRPPKLRCVRPECIFQGVELTVRPTQVLTCVISIGDIEPKSCSYVPANLMRLLEGVSIRVTPGLYCIPDFGDADARGSKKRALLHKGKVVASRFIDDVLKLYEEEDGLIHAALYSRAAKAPSYA